MFTDPNLFFNTTLVNETPAQIINGTLIPGHFQVIAEIYGMDLLISLMIVLVFIQFMIFAYMIFGRNLRRLK